MCKKRTLSSPVTSPIRHRKRERHREQANITEFEIGDGDITIREYIDHSTKETDVERRSLSKSTKYIFSSRQSGSVNSKDTPAKSAQEYENEKEELENIIKLLQDELVSTKIRSAKYRQAARISEYHLKNEREGLRAYSQLDYRGESPKLYPLLDRTAANGNLEIEVEEFSEPENVSLEKLGCKRI